MSDIYEQAAEALAECTPGPWFVHDFTGPEINLLPRARDVTVSCSHPDHITVAEMAGGYMGQEGLNQARIDARLIALAPSMAEELARVKAKLDAAEELAASLYDDLDKIAFSPRTTRAMRAFRTAGETNDR